MRLFIRSLVVAASLGFVQFAGAEELIGTPSGQPMAVSTMTATPVAVSTPAAMMPVAVSTPAAGATVAVATVPVSPTAMEQVAVPVDANRNYGVVAWKKLEGTVQSVDRNNRAMQIQDRDGKNVSVAWNNRIRIYKQGEEVNYSDVAPNDSVVLRYEPNR
jgi:hypothetical protein